MSYWNKKYNIQKIRCCGKLKNGERCKNKFFEFNGILTCHLHKEQKDATYWYTSAIGNFKDVAKMIAGLIDDPNTFNSFARVCRSTAKACHELQSIKMISWRRKIKFTSNYILPNGSQVDENNSFVLKLDSNSHHYLPKLYQTYTRYGALE